MRDLRGKGYDRDLAEKQEEWVLETNLEKKEINMKEVSQKNTCTPTAMRNSSRPRNPSEAFSPDK